MKRTWLGLIAALAGPVSAQDAPPVANRVLVTRALPPLDGGSLRVTVVEVVYAPGQGSRPHSHPCPVIGFVAAGTLRTQVQGEPELVVRAGETFFEPANGVHRVSANASAEVPATLIAYFLCDRAGPLSAPAAGEAP